jgi:hypothetical protein
MGTVKLPIPAIFEGKTYTEVELKTHIQSSVLADTNRIAEKGNQYSALQVYISGGIEKIDDVSDRQTIKNIVGCMPYRSSFLLAIKLALMRSDDTGIEGEYPCPKCGELKKCEYNKNPDLDSRDYISDIKISMKPESEDNTIKYKLKFPIVISDADAHDETVTDIEIEYPSLNHCSMAYNKIGDEDGIRMQMMAYVQALRKVNGNEITREFKNNFGMTMFERSDIDDLKEIGKILEKYGLNERVTKRCNKCGKKFEVVLNTSQLFENALR